MDNESELIWEAYFKHERHGYQSLLDDILDVLGEYEGTWDLEDQSDDTYIHAAKDLDFLSNEEDLETLQNAIRIYKNETGQRIDTSHLWSLITGQGHRDERDGFDY